MLKEIELIGADVNDALQRLGGKEAFYEKLLRKLPDAVEKNPVIPALEEGNIPQAIAEAHTLKGVFGNLSITPLYKAYTTIVDDLRAGQPDKAKALLLEILPLQKKMMECITNN